LRGSKILKEQLSERLQDLTADYTSAKMDLQAAISELTFRKNLEFSKRTVKNSEEPPELCGICLDPLVHEICILPCGQVYHNVCIRQWLLCKSVCPMCKRSIRSNVDLQMVPKTSDDPRTLKLKVQGEWGTKVDALVSDILELLKISDEKCIVFSQWQDVRLFAKQYMLTF
jgi:hypothetical protein